MEKNSDSGRSMWYKLFVVGVAQLAVCAILLFFGIELYKGTQLILDDQKNESLEAVPSWLILNQVVNRTFNTTLTEAVFIQTVGPSTRISNLTFHSTFVTLGDDVFNFGNITVNVGNITVNVGNVTVNGKVDVTGNVTAYDPCDARWNCTLTTVSSLTGPVVVNLPDNRCSGVQECIANGKTAYCEDMCDDICMIQEQFVSAIQCASPLTSNPIEQSYGPMSQCTLKLGTAFYVRFVPSPPGYVEFLYSDSSCVNLVTETYYTFGCQGGLAVRFIQMACSDVCKSDGYGCVVLTNMIPNSRRPPTYCPQVQACEVRGGTVECVPNIAAIPAGRCINANTSVVVNLPSNLNISVIVIPGTLCEANWNCTTQQIQKIDSTFIAIDLPDTECSGVQECIANGKVAYCPHECDNLCMVQELFSSTANCLNATQLDPIQQHAGPMWQCTRKLGTVHFVRYIPGNGMGYVEYTYFDAACKFPVDVIFYSYGCQPLNNVLRVLIVSCNDICNSDGYGCETQTLPTTGSRRPPTYCPQVQACQIQGRVPECIPDPSAFSSEFVGVCSDVCIDGFGCSFVTFTNISTPKQLYVPNLHCPASQQCIANGFTPLCENGPGVGISTNGGDCANLCILQTSWSSLNCAGTIQHVAIAQAYSCQRMWGEDFWFRIVPAPNQFAFYETFSDPGCNTPVARQVIDDDQCYNQQFVSASLEIVNCEQVCQDGCGAFEPGIQPYPFCPTTQQCIADGKTPWCNIDFQGVRRNMTDFACDEICLTVSFYNNLTCAGDLNYQVTISSGECKFYAPGQWALIQSFTGTTLTFALFGESTCLLQTSILTITDGTCNGRFRYNFTFCYNLSPEELPQIIQGSDCALLNYAPGNVAYLPLDSCAQGKGAYCDVKGGFHCVDVCYAFHVLASGSGFATMNMGYIGVCHFDLVQSKYARLDFIGGSTYIYRLFDDPLCTKIDTTIVTSIGDNFGLFGYVYALFVGTCDQINRDYSPYCIPYAKIGLILAEIPDYSSPVVMECIDTQMTPICQYADKTQALVTLGCIDMSVAVRDFTDGFDPCGVGNVPMNEWVTDLECFTVNSLRYSIIPLSSVDSFLLFEWDSQSCSFPAPPVTVNILNNKACYLGAVDGIMFIVGETQDIEDNYGCMIDGYGCHEKWAKSDDLVTNIVLRYPDYKCHAAQQCQTSGRSAVCTFNNPFFPDGQKGEGKCVDIVAWAESYSPPLGSCPNSKSQSFFDFKGALFTISQCNSIEWDNAGATYNDFPGIPFGDSSFILDYAGEFSELLVFSFFSDKGCKSEYSPQPATFPVKKCYGACFGCDTTTWKVDTADGACYYDGYGCPQINLENSAAPCGVGINCRPQYSCETSRGCLAGFGLGPLQSNKIACTVQTVLAETPQMGACLELPLFQNGTHIITAGGVAFPYSEEAWTNLNTPEKYFDNDLEYLKIFHAHGVFNSLVNRTSSTIQPKVEKRQVIDCTIGAALVFSQNLPNLLNISNDALFYAPAINVIYGQIEAINFDGVMEFEYDSINDPAWNSVVTNVGEGIYLIARTTCNGVLVSGTFNYQFSYAE